MQTPGHTHTVSLPFYRLFPSIMTIIGICVGLFALKSGIMGHWERAVTLIVIAGIIDGLDGKIARLFNASSPFGAQLDSLADFLNFGVVPALLVYFWKIDEVKGFGWGAVLFFIVCQAIRLARFNSKIDLEPEIPELKYKFFEGIAAPMGGGLSLLPMMLVFLFDTHFSHPPFEITPIGVMIYVMVIGLLMVSRIPTFSLKGLKISRHYTSLLLAGIAFFVIAAITEPWITFPFLSIMYFLTIPWCCYRYYYLRSKYRAARKTNIRGA
jgi:CDP-diacylglycerol---serine O-phosphatidyltransferase